MVYGKIDCLGIPATRIASDHLNIDKLLVLKRRKEYWLPFIIAVSFVSGACEKILIDMPWIIFMWTQKFHQQIVDNKRILHIFHRLYEALKIQKN